MLGEGVIIGGCGGVGRRRGGIRVAVQVLEPVFGIAIGGHGYLYCCSANGMKRYKKPRVQYKIQMVYIYMKQLRSKGIGWMEKVRNIRYG